MNTDQDTSNLKVQYQISSLGLAGFRRHVLRNLKLKAVIKESHCSQIQQLCFNTCHATRCRNLFGTVGKDQATIYDDEHMADHVAVVANLALSESAESAKDTLLTCCWINSEGISRHPYGDALLAVAGTEPHVLIISVVEAAVVAQLPLHSNSSVIELSAATAVPGLLLALCKDGTLQLWQVSSGQCLLSLKTDAFTAVLHPTGEYFITSNRSAKLSFWNLQPLLSSMPSVQAPEDQATAQESIATAAADVVKEPLLLSPEQEGSVVDCMRFLSADRLAVKTADGRMAVYSMPSTQVVSSWRIPSCSSATASYSSRCSFGHTQDGHYIVVGNHNATAYVYDTNTGLQAARVEAIRVQGSVRACGLSEDCRHLLMAVGSGYVFRFEYRPAADSEDGEEAASEGDSDEKDTRANSDPPPAEVTMQDKQQVQQHRPSGVSSHEQTQLAVPQAAGQGYVDLQPHMPPGQSSPGRHPVAATEAAEAQQHSREVDLHPAVQGQLILRASKTPDPGDTWGTSVGNAAAGWMADECDAGETSGITGATPASGSHAGDTAQELRVAGQLKKPRLDAGAEVSPLIFRPTP